MITRKIEAHLKKLATQFPVITISGPRQSGKTTLAKALFADRPYVSFENPDTREFARQDPRGFLQQYAQGAVFDEIQRTPAIVSYLQQIVDEGGKRCRFVLTGSQQFGLRSQITQSLAGRAAYCTLLPFSYAEWYGQSNINPPALEQVLFAGLYPPVHDRKLDSQLWYTNYIQNYVERDVRQIINIGELRSFQLFVKMCAARTGQLLNLSSLASDCGIAVNTAKAWISVLEASYIIFLLHPHYKNFGKRLIKTPKLYFYDTGILASLLSIKKPEELLAHSMRGAIFESMIVTEIKKYFFNAGVPENLYFWRDRAGLEIDLVREDGEHLRGVEIKSAKTITSDFFTSLAKWKHIAGATATSLNLVYGGEHSQQRQETRVIPWRKAASLFPV